jgi:hypothetical protein
MLPFFGLLHPLFLISPYHSHFISMCLCGERTERERERKREREREREEGENGRKWVDVKGDHGMYVLSICIRKV